MKGVFRWAGRRRQRGVAMSEYLPIVGLIAVMMIGGVGSMGDVLRDQGSKMTQEVAGEDAGHKPPPTRGGGSVDFDTKPPGETDPDEGENSDPDKNDGDQEPDYDKDKDKDKGKESGSGDKDDKGGKDDPSGGGSDGSEDSGNKDEEPAEEDLLESIEQFAKGLWAA